VESQGSSLRVTLSLQAHQSQQRHVYIPLTYSYMESCCSKGCAYAASAVSVLAVVVKCSSLQL
jgi:hypothetical protein